MCRTTTWGWLVSRAGCAPRTGDSWPGWMGPFPDNSTRARCLAKHPPSWSLGKIFHHMETSSAVGSKAGTDCVKSHTKICNVSKRTTRVFGIGHEVFAGFPIASSSNVCGRRPHLTLLASHCACGHARPRSGHPLRRYAEQLASGDAPRLLRGPLAAMRSLLVRESAFVLYLQLAKRSSRAPGCGGWSVILCGGWMPLRSIGATPRRSVGAAAPGSLMPLERGFGERRPI